MKMKPGEQEAKIILEKLGMVFDENYHDDNSQKHMPDFKLSNGRFLEVTHTYHNEDIYCKINKFNKKPIDEQMRIMEKADDAFERYRKGEYCRNLDGTLTENAKQEREKDLKLLKTHNGYDPLNKERPYSEFKCDSPIIYCGADQVLQEIVNDKGKKYANREDVDLFVFVMDSELDGVNEFIQTIKWNGAAQQYFNAIYHTSFQNIYLCVWEIAKQKYNTNDPLLLLITKECQDKEALLEMKYINWNNEEIKY